jgi:FKBP-type peptidyl-prolyl cis-trans isomerase FkpA
VRSVLVCLAAALAMVSCSDSPTTPTANVPYSQIDLLVGTGTEAVAGSALKVNYTGWLYDPAKVDNKGLQFDSSQGRDPLEVIVGAQQVIAGFDQGLVGMKVGGRRLLVIPPSLGYGSVRNGPIPGYSTLIFEIELLSAE